MPSSPSLPGPPGLVDLHANPRDLPEIEEQLVTPACPLFLPYTQLRPYCQRLLALANDDKISRKELIASELNLWREAKKLKELRDSGIFTYLIGFYHTILYQLFKLNDPDDIFQYHILIRLGDLNRYLDRLDVAGYYYCNARNLFPNYGHAFNQLGLLTRESNFYKSCYYHARAAKSIKKPLDKHLAESNLRLVIGPHENSILHHISNDESSLSNAKSDEKFGIQIVLPANAFEWFYVMVAAIYFDNILPVAKPFISFMSENFSIQRATVLREGVKVTAINCDRDGYLLMATLDILLDWSQIGQQGQLVCYKIGNELLQMRASLNSLITSLKNSAHNEATEDLLTGFSETVQNSRPFYGPGNSTPLSPSSLNVSDESSIQSTKESHDSEKLKQNALPHDCVLRGFKPLEVVHEELSFPLKLPIFNGTNGKLDEFGGERIMEQSFIGPAQLMQILTRLKSKINLLSPQIKRKNRNIVIESILDSMSSYSSDV